MRAALISLTGPSSALAGKTLARRQLDFALAAGCGRIIVLGNGASAEAIALRHAAEARGARFQCIGNTHGLLGAVPAGDELLALAPGLLPEEERALEALERGSAVLVLPAAPGVAAGFERIDLERAWAGLLVLPGRLVERLADLPADSEPAAALLRIALQARVTEKRLPEQALADGAWAMIGPGEDPAARQQAWIARHLPSAAGAGAARLVARSGLRRVGVRLLGEARALPALWAGAVLTLAAAVGAAAYDWPALGLLLVAVGVLLAEFGAGLAMLRNAPFGARKRGGAARVVPWLIDAALIACAALAIGGSWMHRLFPPLALLGVLLARRPERWPGGTALLGDRSLLALLFAAAAALGLAEPALMLAVLVLLAADAAGSRNTSRITPA